MKGIENNLKEQEGLRPAAIVRKRKKNVPLQPLEEAGKAEKDRPPPTATEEEGRAFLLEKKKKGEGHEPTTLGGRKGKFRLVGGVVR